MLIGLGHGSRVGKDTCAAILVREHGFAQVAFADPLRDFVLRINPEVADIVEEVGWEQGKEFYPIVRQTLIDVANAARDVISPDVWLRPALEDLKPKTVITDMRYPNEAVAIKGLGGFAVKVTRPGVEPLPNIADQALADFDEWDAVISNDGTFLDLQYQLDELVEKLTVR